MNPYTKKTILNYNKVLAEIRLLEKFYNRRQNIVNLMVVSKTFTQERITPIILNGHKDFGENKVQEGFEKWTEIKKTFPDVTVHLIGPLQSNKVNLALKIFNYIHTIDRKKIAKKINVSIENNFSSNFEKFNFFIQVNTGSEPQKSGIGLTEVDDFFKWCVNETKLKIIGLMCIPPIDESPKKHFEILNKLASKYNLQQLSMGMSNDYKTAIECGSTFLRLGSAILGKRHQSI
tara:strand:- start:2934 stop:3632 length:699 start_codon:yes stop_codon:yes gene_type:complete